MCLPVSRRSVDAADIEPASVCGLVSEGKPSSRVLLFAWHTLDASPANRLQQRVCGGTTSRVPARVSGRSCSSSQADHDDRDDTSDTSITSCGTLVGWRGRCRLGWTSALSGISRSCVTRATAIRRRSGWRCARRLSCVDGRARCGSKPKQRRPTRTTSGTHAVFVRRWTQSQPPGLSPGRRGQGRGLSPPRPARQTRL